MKNTRRILACFLAVLMTLSCFTFISVSAENAPSVPASVYDPSVTATLSEAVDGIIYIDSANEFMAFAKAIVANTTFAGITVKLTCDVVINQGDVSTWTNPYEWNACSNNFYGRFAGSFDGQGHTISGIYNNHAKEAGLFGRVTGGNTIQNVNIVNSYFELTGGDGDSGAGAVIGFLDPEWGEVTTTIKNVHVDSTVAISGSASGAGGLVGKTANADNVSIVIEECSFNGTVNATRAENVGGIGGYVRAKNVNIEKSTVDATINGGAMVGGIVGQLNYANANISNCLVEGTVNANVKVTGNVEGVLTKYRSGAIIGWTRVSNNMTVMINNVLAAVKCNSHEALITTIYGDEGQAGNVVKFILDGIVYDKDVQEPDCYIRRDNVNKASASVNGSATYNGGNWRLDNPGGSIDAGKFNTTAKTTSELKGQPVFNFWTAVEGDYPTPPTGIVPDLYDGTPSTDYVVDGNNIIINTAEQFMGFMNAANGGTATFSGKTVKLNRDIVINVGDASTFGSGSHNWTAAQGWDNRFAGNFDGQGHTISGIYSDSSNAAGLFGWATGLTEFKNVNIVNSKFVSWGGTNGNGMGAIIGCIDPSWGGGTTTISNVHVDAIFEGPQGVPNVGGLVGGVTNHSNASLIIENCSVNATMNTSGSAKVGGLVGYMKGIDLVIENCSANAAITCTNNGGGLVGRLESCNVRINNCFAEGTVKANKEDHVSGGVDPIYYTSPIIGCIDLWDKGMMAQMSNVLTAVKCEPKCETAIATIRGDASYRVRFDLDNIVYDSSVQTPDGLVRRDNGTAPTAQVNNSSGVHTTNMYLEAQLGSTEYFCTTGKTTSELKGAKVFEFWTVVEGDYPTPPTTSTPDFYNGAANDAYAINSDAVINIYTAEQLMGFADAIVNGNSFSGKTIKLNRDIIINKGDASTWGTNAPAYNWNAYSKGFGARFAGNFDGQGHVISGIYSKHDTAAGLFGRTTGGNTVQNVSIVNSYFESTGAVTGDGTGVGAIFGVPDAWGLGAVTATIKNVHVEATVVGSSSNVHSTGGLVGRFHNSDALSVVIENCSFNGTITSAGNKVGGLIGGLSATNLSITNCSVNANITAQKTAGGLVGRALKVDNTTISDCLVVADINVTEADTTAGVIGYYATEYAAGNATISDTLVSVRGENVLAVSLGHWGKDGKMLTVTLDNVKYDSNRFNGNKAREIYTSAGDLLVQNGNLSAMTFEQIKGNAIFDGWTAVKGDYPVPTSAIDPLKAFVFESYGSATEVLGYQTKYNGDGTYGVRLIATLINALDANYIAAGFKDIKVTLTNGEVKIIPVYYCKYSYNSVMGGGATYNAADYLADKFFCLTIDNARATIASVEATPFVMTGEGTEPVCGEAVSWTLVETEPADQITVMSLNVYLHDDADPDGDGPATAQDRLNGIQAQVLAADPDVLCVQEDNWSETLDALLIDNGYTALRGEGISGSGEKNLLTGKYESYEYLTIYYKTGEFTVGAKGQKWLSTTPDIYSDSYGDGNTRTRGFNYVELTSVATGETFFVFNTHLENGNSATRMNQANKLIELVGQIAGETPYVVCGDFNLSSNPNDGAQEDKPNNKSTLSALLGAFDNTRLTAALTDTHATFINNGGDSDGTHFGVADATVTPTSGIIIDYCFTSKGDFNVYSYDVVAEKQNGIYTSDHLPIVIKLAVKSAE